MGQSCFLQAIPQRYLKGPDIISGVHMLSGYDIVLQLVGTVLYCDGYTLACSIMMPQNNAKMAMFGQQQKQLKIVTSCRFWTSSITYLAFPLHLVCQLLCTICIMLYTEGVYRTFPPRAVNGTVCTAWRNSLLITLASSKLNIYQFYKELKMVIVLY